MNTDKKRFNPLQDLSTHGAHYLEGFIAGLKEGAVASVQDTANNAVKRVQALIATIQSLFHLGYAEAAEHLQEALGSLPSAAKRGFKAAKENVQGDDGMHTRGRSHGYFVAYYALDKLVLAVLLRRLRKSSTAKRIKRHRGWILKVTQMVAK